MITGRSSGCVRAFTAGLALAAAFAAGLLSAAAQTPPQAAPPPPPAPPPALVSGLALPPKLIDEVKIGGLAHDVGLGDHHVESGADVNLELLFTPPEILSFLGSPRPHIGGNINTDGNTSAGYFGLTWGITLIQNLFGTGDGLFANGSLGGAVHDGYLDSAPPDRKKLGSPILFRESVELGVQLTPVISVSGFVDHMSNANLAGHNAGVTNAGGRLGFKF
ncbi:MAG: acyloxyacyl hydrolase [Alphaproteobacteria bacterium]|nr:acyloxyacyl hydrolase [Alphaproteobacteria bacterium]